MVTYTYSEAPRHDEVKHSDSEAPAVSIAILVILETVLQL